LNRVEILFAAFLLPGSGGGRVVRKTGGSGAALAFRGVEAEDGGVDRGPVFGAPPLLTMGAKERSAPEL